MDSLKQQLAAMRKALFDEGILDNCFTEVEGLADDEKPDFAEDMMFIFINEQKEFLLNLEKEMENNPIDFSKIDKELHQLKGISASVGANKVKIAVIETQTYCREKNAERARAAFKQIKVELDLLDAKLDSYFQLVKQAHAEDDVPPK